MEAYRLIKQPQEAANLGFASCRGNKQEQRGVLIAEAQP
jgi:hypothetical protein